MAISEEVKDSKRTYTLAHYVCRLCGHGRVARMIGPHPKHCGELMRVDTAVVVPARDRV